MSKLEIAKVLKAVEKSITEVAAVEGEIEKIVRVGNCQIIKFRNRTVYKIELMSKQTTPATMDFPIEMFPGNGVKEGETK